MNQEKITIIVPIYNAAEFVALCLESIVNQSYSNIEVILINDGSTDNSSRIIDDFASNDERIKIINQKNLGVSVARNRGIDNATGKYIIFIDADDYLLDIRALENVHTTSVGHPCDVIMYDIKYEDKKTHYPLNEGGYFSKEDIDSFLFEVIKEEHFNSPCNKLYSKEILNKYNIRFDKNIKIGEDLLFNIDYFKHCSSLYYLNNNLYYYRTSNLLSATSTYKKKKYSNLMYVNDALSLWSNTRDSKKLVSVSKYIRIKNILSCMRDIANGRLPYSHVMRELQRYRESNRRLIVRNCGAKLYIISLIYSFIDMRLIYLLIKALYGKSKKRVSQ